MTTEIMRGTRIDHVLNVAFAAMLGVTAWFTSRAVGRAEDNDVRVTRLETISQNRTSEMERMWRGLDTMAQRISMNESAIHNMVRGIEASIAELKVLIERRLPKESGK
jgi:hypothetical protein